MLFVPSVPFEPFVPLVLLLEVRLLILALVTVLLVLDAIISAYGLFISSFLFSGGGNGRFTLTPRISFSSVCDTI